MAASVQFYGIDNAVKAYENNSCAAWALFQGRQLLFRFSGEDISDGAKFLNEVLELIESSNATYTLKVFEKEGKQPVKIKENTPCDGSFNFKLVPEEVYQQRDVQRSISGAAIESKLSAIENRLNEIEAMEEVEESEPETITEKLGNIFLNEPEKIPQMVGALQSLLSIVFGNKQTIPAATIGGIAETQPKDQNDFQINQAVDVLKQYDSKLGEHLMKLAAIAQSDKASWQMLLNMIDKM